MYRHFAPVAVGAFILAAYCLTRIAVSAGAQSASLPPTAAPVDGASTAAGHPAAAKSDSDDVGYEAGGGDYVDKLHEWQMIDGVKFTQGDAVLETQSALVSLDSDMNAESAQSQSSVHIFNPKDDLTGDRGFINFKTHIATLKDHIILISKPDDKAPKASVRSQMKNPATITCDEIVYDYKHKTGNVPGEITVTQTSRVLTADAGQYDGNLKTVTLTGHVHAKQADGSVIDASEVVAGIEEGNEWIEVKGPVHGRMQVKKSAVGDDDSTTPAPPPALPPITPAPTDSTPAAASTSAAPPPSSPAGTTVAH